jgi:hypothetical protein
MAYGPLISHLYYRAATYIDRSSKAPNPLISPSSNLPSSS